MTAGEQSGWIERRSTDIVGDRERFSYFCEAICDTYVGIRPENDTCATFDARFAVAPVDAGILAHIEAPGHTAKRDRQTLHRQPDDSFYLNFSQYASYKASYLRVERTVPAGVPLLLANEHPFEVRFQVPGRMNLYSLRIPRAMLGRSLSTEEILRANHALAEASLGRLLATQMRLLCEAFRLDDRRSAGTMSQSVVSLLARLLSEAGDVRRSQPHLLALESTKSCALPFIADPDFHIGQLAAALGCTPRTLQKQFARNGETFTTWLMAERLDRARHLLGSPAYRMRSVESIAFACGFREATHFRRSFKARFGMSPGAARDLG